MSRSELIAVPDNFNPYAEWLGLADTLISPNHYELLGIDESVTDAAAIASAADRAMTRVRACKPGANAAAWAQLLDQITDAKKTLTDPAQRDSYNRQRKTPTAQAAAPVNPNLLPPGQGVPQPVAMQPVAHSAFDPMAPVAPVAPIATSSQPLSPQIAQPVPGVPVPQAVPYLQPATTVAPNPMAPIANVAPMAPIAPTIPQAMPTPIAPVPQAAPVAQAIPVSPSPMAPVQPMAVPVAAPMPMQAAPVASPMLAGQPMPVGQSEAVEDVPTLKRKRSATARAQASAGGMLGPILLGGSVGGLIIVVVGVGFYLGGSQSEPEPVVASVSPPPTVPGGGGVASTMPRRLDEIPESERPQPQNYTPPTPAPSSPEFETPSMQPEVPVMTEPAPEMTPPPSAPEEMPDTTLSREELRSLAQSLTTARAAIGELNFPVSDREIAKALAIAKSDEHKTKIRRLQLLSDYVSRFRAAISSTLGRLQSGEAVSFENDLVINIVESSPDRLIFRMSGKRFEYDLPNMPVGLTRRLGEMSLDKTQPETIAMKAAFAAVNPRISDKELEQVNSWWTEAASVRDVQDLITAINDDYSLRQDAMDAPLDPNAMAALTARADRLKDARTIEAFAKEYQAAIDESLKTIEANTELNVGNSTTIVIRELKPDRVMLTVADETRGFQFTKLPLGLAASLAERILPREAPLTMVMKGAYYAAREKGQANKQFRPLVFTWWKEAGEMDQQLQPVLRELAAQYPE
ncbi:MAG TPA: hypothetical protein P5307_13510 [Pirellulaceae bacterium]|nr:hypothetical protein [Planctomycetales bacterium]HRX80081.1 hypothetical protein [Pirellulaceae bacterium]